MNIFEQFGIKEVCNFTAYLLADEGDLKAGDIALRLDTLKVSSMETTAEESSARGGIGNSKLITWDYGKEMNVNLEDALFSPATLATCAAAKLADGTKSQLVDSEEIIVTTTDVVQLVSTTATSGKNFRILNKTKGTRATVTNATGGKLTMASATPAMTLTAGDRLFVSWEYTGKNVDSVMTITAADFPGTYRWVGDTVVRNAKTLKDEAFQIYIEKGKIGATFSMNMQAEGDPATFTMPLTILRDDGGNMVTLVKKG